MRDVNYHELKTKDETIKWFEKNYGEFIANNNSNCYKKNTLGNSLFAYTGNMSGCYNEILELNKGSIDNIEKYIKQYYQEDNLNDTEQKILDIVAEDSERDIKLIYSAFDYNTIPQNIYLYHYFNNFYFKEKIKKNKTIQINRFISTTCIKKGLGKDLISRNRYDTFVKIRVNKGTPCIPIGNNYNSCLKEYEIILKPQSRFRIIKNRKRLFSKIKREIECELL